MIKAHLPKAELTAMNVEIKKAVKRNREGVIDALEITSVKGQKAAVQAIQSQNGEFTGQLRKSLVRHVDRVNLEATLTAGGGNSELKYARAAEFGFPAKYVFPPAHALVDWVRKKLGVSDKEAKGVAFLVARKIWNEGRPAKPFMRPSFKSAMRVMRMELMKLKQKV